ncbi:MAG: hypothetical protein HC812_12640 [Leptolyngbya sp. RL_3_1]|nr:hypothetical protein [Leptolyngbya sp. RL_3_1]
MATYRASARQRDQQKRDRLQARYQQGRAIAQQAAALLKQDFQVEKVVLFGSMISGDRIHDHSERLFEKGVNQSWIILESISSLAVALMVSSPVLGNPCR